MQNHLFHFHSCDGCEHNFHWSSRLRKCRKSSWTFSQRIDNHLIHHSCHNSARKEEKKTLTKSLYYWDTQSHRIGISPFSLSLCSSQTWHSCYNSNKNKCYNIKDVLCRPRGNICPCKQNISLFILSNGFWGSVIIALFVIPFELAKKHGTLALS